MKFKVSISSIKDKVVLAETVVSKERELGIIIEGKIQLLSVLRFDKRKHSISYVLIEE